MRRLQGRRVAITRAIHDTATLAELLRLEGAQPIFLPVVAYKPRDVPDLEDQLRQLGPHDWLVLTSATSLRFLKDQLSDVRGVCEHLRLACVGPETARAVENLGLRVAFVPTRYTSQELAKTLLLGATTTNVVWLRPHGSDPRWAQMLADRGATVRMVGLYETIAHPFDAVGRKALQQGLDAITFASSSAVDHFFDQLDDAIRGNLTSVVLACIGPVTAESLSRRGATADVVPTEHTLSALVQGLANFFDVSPRMPNHASKNN